MQTESLPEPEPYLTPTGSSRGPVYPGLSPYPELASPHQVAHVASQGTLGGGHTTCVPSMTDVAHEGVDINHRPRVGSRASSENPFGEDDDEDIDAAAAQMGPSTTQRIGKKKTDPAQMPQHVQAHANASAISELSEYPTRSGATGVVLTANLPTAAIEAINYRNRRNRTQESKNHQLFRSTLKCNMVTFFATAVFLWLQRNVSLIPEPIIDLFLPMVRFMAETERQAHFEHNQFNEFHKRPYIVSFYMKYVDINVNPLLPFTLGFILFVIGVHAMRGSRRCLEVYKGATCICTICSMVAMLFTVYMWSMLPVIKEILPRCDAYRFCRPPSGGYQWDSLVPEEVMRDCILGKPTEYIPDPLPADCAWTQNFFLDSCKDVEVPTLPAFVRFPQSSFLGLDEANDTWSPLWSGSTELPPSTDAVENASFLRIKIMSDPFPITQEEVYVTETDEQHRDDDGRVDTAAAALSLIAEGKEIKEQMVEQRRMLELKKQGPKPNVEHECTMNWAVMAYFHDYLNNFGGHLMAATTSFWLLILIFALNMVTAYACFVNATNFGKERDNDSTDSTWQQREARGTQARLNNRTLVVTAAAAPA